MKYCCSNLTVRSDLLQHIADISMDFAIIFKVLSWGKLQRKKEMAASCLLILEVIRKPNKNHPGKLISWKFCDWDILLKIEIFGKVICITLSASFS